MTIQQNYIDQFIIEEKSIDSTYCRISDVGLMTGSQKCRMIFLVEGNTTIDVYVEVITNGIFDEIKSFFLSLMDEKFVQSTYQGKIIYINVNSLSNRMGIPKEEIYQDAKNHEFFGEMIEYYKDKYIKDEIKIEKVFNRLLKSKYEDDAGSELKIEGNETISKSNLRKIIGIMFFNKLNLNEQRSFSLDDGNILLLSKERKKKLPAMYLFTNKFLGRGCFGSVQTVQELSRKCLFIAKIAYYIFTTEEEGMDSIKHERDFLDRIHNNKSHVSGIQLKIQLIFDFILDGDKYFGYIAPKYDGDVRRLISTLTMEEKIECVRQLLEGLIVLEDEGIVHNDIKSDNCLFKRHKDGSIDCVIADFGISFLHSNTKGNVYRMKSVIKELLYSYEDEEKIIKLITKMNEGNAKTALEEFNSLFLVAFSNPVS